MFHMKMCSRNKLIIIIIIVINEWNSLWKQHFLVAMNHQGSVWFLASYLSLSKKETIVDLKTLRSHV